MPFQRTRQSNMLGGVVQQDEKVRPLSSFEEAFNLTTDPVKGLRRRRPIQFLDDTSENTANAAGETDRWYSYKRDNDEEYHFKFQDDNAGDGVIKAWNAETGESMVVVEATGSQIDADYITRSHANPLEYLALGSGDAEDKLRANTIQDTTFIWNREATPAMDSVVIPDVAPYSFVFCVAGNYQTTYEIEVQNGSSRQKATVTTWDGTTAITNSAFASGWVVGTSTELKSVKTEDIIAVLTLELRALTGYTIAGDVEACGAVLFIRSTLLSGLFASDSVGDSTMRAFYDSSPRVEGHMPTIGIDFVKTFIEGSAEIDADDYWVEFRNGALYDYVHGLASINDQNTNTNTGLRLGKGNYQESIEDGTAHAIDPTTMPLKMTREVDDGAGTVTGTPFAFYFLVNFVRWDDKAVGLASDEEPSFIGVPINDVFFYKERLGLLGGNKINFAETGNFFNFFRVTKLTLRDTAPIDVTVPHNQPVEFTHALVGSEDVTLFSHLGQFIIPGAEILSPRTIEVLPSSSYPSSATVAPIASGRRLFTVFDRGGYVGIRELYKDTQATRYQDVDITLSVPTLIVGTCRRIWSDDNNNTLLVQTNEDLDKLYVYRWLFSGNDKAISAWTVYNLPSSLHTGLFSGNDFRLMAQKPKFSLAFAVSGTMPFGADTDDVLLDWWVDETNVNSKVFSSPNTTIVCPIPGGTSEVAALDYRFISYDGTTPQEVVVPVGAWTDGLNLTLVVPGDYSSASFKIGLEYESSFVYTKPYVREAAGQAGTVHVDDVQKVMRGYLSYSGAAQIAVGVTISGRAEKTYLLDKVKPTADYSLWPRVDLNGELQFPIKGKPAQGTVEVKTSEPWDFNLQGTQWDILFYQKTPLLQG